MSMLKELPSFTVQRAAGRALNNASQVEADRALTARIAWALFRTFQGRTIRVPLFWGMKWTVRLGDLAPFWALLFGPEVPAEADPLDFPPPDGDDGAEGAWPPPAA